MEEMLIWLALSVSIILTLISFASVSFGLSFLVGAPFVATPKKIAKEMLEFAGLKEGETFIDLGSGDGTILFVAAEQFGVKKAIGYEINPVLVLVTNIRARLRRGDQVQVTRANIFTTKIEQVDVISTYLWPSTMKKLVTKLKADLKPETRVISRGFQFHQAEPIKSKKGSKSMLYLYRVGDL